MLPGACLPWAGRSQLGVLAWGRRGERDHNAREGLETERREREIIYREYKEMKEKNAKNVSPGAGLAPLS